MKYALFIGFLIFGFGCSQPVAFTPGSWEKIEEGQPFPEGPAWDSDRGILYNSNCYGNWISKYENGQSDTFITNKGGLFTATNGLAYDKGCLYACDFKAGKILKISGTGEVTTLIEGYKGEPFSRPNDIIVDHKGNLWFTDTKSYGRDKKDGCLFRYSLKQKVLILVQDDLTYPNGLTISPDNKYLYLGESAQESVFRWEILKNGTLRDKELFIQLEGGDPDGMEFGPDGNLYIAHFGGGNIYAVSPNREIIHILPTPGKKPTNVEWGGKDKQTLFLTETETNAVYKMNSQR